MQSKLHTLFKEFNTREDRLAEDLRKLFGKRIRVKIDGHGAEGTGTVVGVQKADYANRKILVLENVSGVTAHNGKWEPELMRILWYEIDEPVRVSL